MSNDYLLLKFGTLKAWRIASPEMSAAADEIDKRNLGWSMSTTNQAMTPAHKQAVCELIDACQGQIQNDWDGKIMTKDEAKAYIQNYPN